MREKRRSIESESERAYSISLFFGMGSHCYCSQCNGYEWLRIKIAKKKKKIKSQLLNKKWKKEVKIVNTCCGREGVNYTMQLLRFQSLFFLKIFKLFYFTQWTLISSLIIPKITINIENKYIETFLLQINFSKFTRKLVYTLCIYTSTIKKKIAIYTYVSSNYTWCKSYNLHIF